MASACAVGPREGQGPLGDCFDLVAQDAAFGQDSYEQAEAALLREACRLCLAKANIGEKGVQAMVGGDLLNQIMPSALAARELKFPFLGLYGACSTISEGLLTGGMMCDGGYASPYYAQPAAIMPRRSGSTATRWNTAISARPHRSGRSRAAVQCCSAYPKPCLARPWRGWRADASAGWWIWG